MIEEKDEGESGLYAISGPPQERALDGWSVKELLILIQAVQKYGTNNWAAVCQAFHIPSVIEDDLRESIFYTPEDCESKYSDVLRGDLINEIMTKRSIVYAGEMLEKAAFALRAERMFQIFESLKSCENTIKHLQDDITSIRSGSQDEILEELLKNTDKAPRIPYFGRRSISVEASGDSDASKDKSEAMDTDNQENAEQQDEPAQKKQNKADQSALDTSTDLAGVGDSAEMIEDKAKADSTSEPGDRHNETKVSTEDKITSEAVLNDDNTVSNLGQMDDGARNQKEQEENAGGISSSNIDHPVKQASTHGTDNVSLDLTGESQTTCGDENTNECKASIDSGNTSKASETQKYQNGSFSEAFENKFDIVRAKTENENENQSRSSQTPKDADMKHNNEETRITENIGTTGYQPDIDFNSTKAQEIFVDEDDMPLRRLKERIITNSAGTAKAPEIGAHTSSDTQEAQDSERKEPSDQEFVTDSIKYPNIGEGEAPNSRPIPASNEQPVTMSAAESVQKSDATDRVDESDSKQGDPSQGVKAETSIYIQGDARTNIEADLTPSAEDSSKLGAATADTCDNEMTHPIASQSSELSDLDRTEMKSELVTAEEKTKHLVASPGKPPSNSRKRRSSAIFDKGLKDSGSEKQSADEGISTPPLKEPRVLRDKDEVLVNAAGEPIEFILQKNLIRDLGLKSMSPKDRLPRVTRLQEAVLTPPPSTVAHVESEETRLQRTKTANMLKVWTTLYKHKYSRIFHEPVTTKEAPDYRELVRRPMDFSTMRIRLEDGFYKSYRMFYRDALLIFANCMCYNQKGSDLFDIATILKGVLQKEMEAYLGIDSKSEHSTLKPATPTANQPEQTPVKPHTQPSASASQPDSNPGNASDCSMDRPLKDLLGSTPHSLRHTPASAAASTKEPPKRTTEPSDAPHSPPMASARNRSRTGDK